MADGDLNDAIDAWFCKKKKLDAFWGNASSFLPFYVSDFRRVLQLCESCAGNARGTGLIGDFDCIH